MTPVTTLTATDPAAPDAQGPDPSSTPSEPPVPDWEELVTAALLGTDRKPLPGADPATALLDQAAAGAVRRRAGLLPADPPALDTRPGPAPSDPRPPLPDAARRHLDTLLAARGGFGELLPEWLTAARRAGYRAPSSRIPALLEAARSRSELRAEAVAFAGPRAAWLAARNRTWSYVARTPPPEPPGPDAPPPSPGATGADEDAPVPRLWAEGVFAERVGLLAAERRRDPDAARAMLRSTWSTERAEDRAHFLDTLVTGLGPSDEPFLEQALDDRAKSVRASAADLLRRLPGSALSARMSARARDCVSLAGAPHDRGRRILVIEPPTECGPAMRRDGIAADSPTGRGRRAWLLGEIVAAAPLSTWTDAFALTPAEIVALPVADTWRGELHEAWSRAAVRHSDAEWARAVLGDPEASGEPPNRLLAVLGEADRADWTTRYLRAHPLADAVQMLSACPGPWPAELSLTVVETLARAAAGDRRGHPWGYTGILGLAGRRLAPAPSLPEVERLSDAQQHEPWRDAFTTLSRTLHFRSAAAEALSPPPTSRANLDAPGPPAHDDPGQEFPDAPKPPLTPSKSTRSESLKLMKNRHRAP